ncbi:MAG: hypothetical protein CMQ24_21415 [Gammaproteobacteria bacterium]|nr:hypothetical protein [Gammaproteobacteria bacterium]
MSKTDQSKEAEREARRARRLAERAEARARRKADQARRAEARARELSKRAHGGSGSSPRGIDDMPGDVSARADAWIEEQTGRILEGAVDQIDKHTREAERAAERAAEVAAEAGRNARDTRRSARREAERQRRKARRRRESEESYDYDAFEDWGDWGTWWGGRSGWESKSERRARHRAERARRRKLRRKGQGSQRGLYRDDKHGHIFGVCAGIADYFYMETWQIRMAALAGLFFFPGITLPAYFIADFVMDPKPYYRRVTDRFQELDDEPTKAPMPRSERRQRKQAHPAAGPERIDNAQAMRSAKAQFADIEERLRAMEGHVTSPSFELKREIRKMSGDS